MTLTQCKRCSKIFSKIRSPYCYECNEEIERQFKLVRDYLDENPFADLSELVEKTGAESKILNHLIREERLTFKKAVSIPCQSCGKLITSGRYCSECTRKLTSEFAKAEQEIGREVKKINSDKRQELKRNDDGIHINNRKF